MLVMKTNTKLMDVLVQKISQKCITYASSINATKLSGQVIHKCVRDTLLYVGVAIDPEYIYDKVRILIEEEGVDIR